jgi:hypothetical protein
MMMLTVFLTIVALIVAPLMFLTWRDHRTPAEVRGDWWPRFEREFRAYADRHRA